MFYCFNQNNSGGRFVRTRFLDDDVIIEADSPQEANARAQRIGIYFDGCDTGRDCSCCGDRWYEQSDDREGDPEPSVYGTVVTDLSADREPTKRTTVVHYRDGTIRYGKDQSKWGSLAVNDDYQDSGDGSIEIERQTREQALARFGLDRMGL